MKTHEVAVFAPFFFFKVASFCCFSIFLHLLLHVSVVVVVVQFSASTMFCGESEGL